MLRWRWGLAREKFHALRQAYREVVAKFLIASERFRAGERLTVFPEGTFPPAPPAPPTSASPRVPTRSWRVIVGAASRI